MGGFRFPGSKRRKNREDDKLDIPVQSKRDRKRKIDEVNDDDNTSRASDKMDKKSRKKIKKDDELDASIQNRRCKNKLDKDNEEFEEDKDNDDSSKFECEHCDKTFKNTRVLRRHIIHFHPDLDNTPRPFKCERCDKSFVMRRNLRLHLENVHGDVLKVESDPCECPHCQSTFTAQRFLKLHINSAHKDSHQCEVCEKTFKSPKEKSKHIKNKHGSDLSCRICKKKFTKIKTLSEHVSLHATDTPFMCKSCNKSFKLARYLAQHVKTVHDAPETRNFQCDICGKAYKTRLHLNKHNRQIHAEKKPTCEVCNKSFKDASELAVHEEECRQKEMEIGQPALVSLEDRRNVESLLRRCERHLEKGSEESTPYNIANCPFCRKAMPISTLKNHMRYYHKNNNPCKVCGLILESFAKRIEHQKTRHDVFDPFQCAICDAKFSAKSYLTLHMLSHSDERNYKCQYCNKEFNKSSNRDAHVHNIHGHKRGIYQCPHCSSILSSEDSLRGHIYKKHRPPYKCGICNRPFWLRRKMIMHQKTCNGKTPWKCPLCSKAYTTKSDLRIHMQIHLAKIKCPKCDKEYHRQTQLWNHLLIHHFDQRIIKCSECPRMFNTNNQLDLHWAKMHAFERHFKCVACPKTFTEYHRLQCHIKYCHVLIRNIKCDNDNCTYLARTRYEMRTHQRRAHERKMTYPCEDCSKVFQNETRLRKHEQSMHADKRPYKCEKCCMSFKRELALKRHQDWRDCQQCSYSFDKIVNRKLHFSRQHDMQLKNFLIIRKQQQLLREMKDLNSHLCFENLLKIHELSEEVYDYYNRRRKVYVCSHTPPKSSNIADQMEGTGNPYYISIGKCSCGIETKHLSLHHRMKKYRNHLSTCMLTKLSGFKCIHFCDIWISKVALIDDVSRQGEVDYLEAQMQLYVLLFAQYYKRSDIFFQKLEVGPLRAITKEDLETMIADIKASNGNFLNLKPFSVQFLKEYELKKADRSNNYKCRYCHTTDNMFTPVLRQRHEAKCTKRKKRNQPLDPHDVRNIFELKELDADKILEILWRPPVENDFICYSILGLPMKVKTLAEALKMFREHKRSQAYHGQNSSGHMSDYHFLEFIASTLKTMKKMGLNLYYLYMWKCPTARDMYRLELALMFNTLIRGRIAGRADALANSNITLWNLKQWFTDGEIKSLVEYSKHHSLLEGDSLPSFLKGTGVTIFEEITDKIPISGSDSSFKPQCVSDNEDDEGAVDCNEKEKVVGSGSVVIESTQGKADSIEAVPEPAAAVLDKATPAIDENVDNERVPESIAVVVEEEPLIDDVVEHDRIPESQHSFEYPCGQCRFSTNDREEMWNHSVNVHDFKFSKSDSPPDVKLAADWKSKKNKRCYLCHQVFVCKVFCHKHVEWCEWMIEKKKKNDLHANS